MEITLVRHATLLVKISGKTLLVDPMLGSAESMPPIQNSPNDRRNPLVQLPHLDLSPVDAVLVTHTHADHFDPAAAETLEKGLPILCQLEDEEKFRSFGFVDVRVVEDSERWGGIALHRTGGRHGTGGIGARMAPVSGFVLKAPGEPVLYVAGDTIWCSEVEEALNDYQPNVIVVNAGAAQFVTGDPITMSAGDVTRVIQHAPDATIVAVHMEAINHCLLARDDLREQLDEKGLLDQARIPADAERLNF